MLWFLPLLLLLGGRAAASPPVKVSLRTSWPAPPFLVEIMYALFFYSNGALLTIISETVALENPDSFFPFLDHVTDPEVVTITPNDAPEAIYSSSLEVANNMGLFAESGVLASIEMNLALHSATPKIEAFYHHYSEAVGESARNKECGSWVDWYGSVVCDVESLAHLAGLDTIDSTENNS